MKTKFTKFLLSIMVIVYFLLNSTLSFSQRGVATAYQWAYSPHTGGGYNPFLLFSRMRDTYNTSIPVYAMNYNVEKGQILQPGVTGYNDSKFIVQKAINSDFAHRLKAIAGTPDTLEININIPNGELGFANCSIGDGNRPLVRYGTHIVGNKMYDSTITWTKVLETNFPGSAFRQYTFKTIIVFKHADRDGYLFITIPIYNGGENNTRYEEFIVPYVVEGIVDTNVPILGTTVEPQIPELVLHNPPGDGSYAAFQTDQETCRSFSEAISSEDSHNGNVKVTLGIAGAIGFIVTTKFEFSVSISATLGGGRLQARQTSTQKCIKVTNTVQTVPSTAGANNSIFAGYGTTLAIGMYRTLSILPNNVMHEDTGIAYLPIAYSPFYKTKTQIVADSLVQYNTYSNRNNPLSTRRHAINQNKVWKQVLVNDSLNVRNASTLIEDYTLEGNAQIHSYAEAVSVANTSNIEEVSHYLEGGVGVGFVVNVGGSGVEGGYEFKTKKSYGQTISNTTNTSTTISYSLFDNDPGDAFPLHIVKDPTYGTPIFKIVPNQLYRSSSPYEGGYQRDQPELRFTAAPTSRNYTAPNVAVCQQSIFGINLCNNSNEPRTYNLRFNPLSNANGANIAISGTTGNTEFGVFPVAANICHPSTFFAFVTQANAAALSSQDINLELYPANDQAITSDIFATCNWGNYAPPTGISTGQTTICQGASTNVSLSATCVPGTIPTWYNTSAGGVAIGTGSPLVQLPIVSSNYFVSCNSGIFNYPRFSANVVTVNPSPAPLTISANGPLAFCSPESITLKSFLGNINNALTFTRVNSQYITVPHSASINLGIAFTMEAWVNYSGQDITIIDKGNYDFLWSLNPNTNLSKMGFYTRGKGAWVYSTGTVPQNTWTHVAITLNAGRLTFYINGVASGTDSIATASQDTQPMNIGRQQPTFCACNHFNETMDELRIWNLARTPSQIKAYLNSVPTNSTGLVAYYKFDEATGTTTSDATSYGNNGTFVNSPTRQIPSTVPSNVVNALWTPSNTTAPSITASTFGTYTASITNGFGCTNSASVVTSSLSPMPTAQVNAFISTGANITLTATGCSGGTGTYTLKWYKSSDNSLVTMPVSPAITTNYYAKCEQALNSVICLSPASANVTVNVGNYINSIISGNWESTNTWTPSRVPLPTDVVIINNHTVTITSNAANAKRLEYKSGATLRYLNAAAKLNVGF